MAKESEITVEVYKNIIDCMHPQGLVYIDNRIDSFVVFKFSREVN